MGKNSFFTSKREITIHLAFWLGFFFLFSFFWSGRMDIEDALFRGIVLTLFEMIVVYVNLKLLVPRYLPQNQYGPYILFALLLVIIVVWLYTYIDHFWLREFFQENRPLRGLGERHQNRPPFRGIEPIEPNLGRRKRVFASLAFNSRLMFHSMLTLAVMTISTVYALSQIVTHREKEAALLKSEKLDAEMKFLRSQINPHFLFNALNNAYTLAYIKSEQAPEVILKLSDILRYIIYDCKADKVPLDKEIQYISNYIDLQKIKTGDRTNISATFDNTVTGITIEPMLFIPFIENSFKHSHIEDEEHGWISIQLSVQENTIKFEVENSMPKTAYTKDKVGGIGVENVQKRLEMLYPQRHKLIIWPDEERYRVLLEINLN